MALPSRIYIIANCMKSSFGHIRFPVVKTFQNALLGSHQRSIFTSSSMLAGKVKVNNHGSLRSTLMVVDESGAEIGTMKWSQLNCMAVEKSMKIHCVNENAMPNPIYKLISAQAKKETKNQTKNKPRKTKEIVFKPSIGENDLKIKFNHIMEWLQKDLNVKIKVEAHSADNKHLELYKILSKLISEDTSVATMVNETKTTEHGVTFVVHPMNLEESTTSVPNPLTLEELKAKDNAK